MQPSLLALSFLNNHDPTPIPHPNQLFQAALQKFERKHQQYLKNKKLATIAWQADQLMIEQLARKAKM